MKGTEWTIMDDAAIQAAQEALEADRRGYGQARRYNQRQAELLAALREVAPGVRWKVKTAEEREVDEMMGRVPKGRPWGEYEINAVTADGSLTSGMEHLRATITLSAQHMKALGAEEVARQIAVAVRIELQHAERLFSAPSASASPAPPYHPNARCAHVPRIALRKWMKRPRRRRRSRWRIPASLLGGACLIAGLVGTEWARTDGRFIDGLVILVGCAFLMYAASLRKP